MKAITVVVDAVNRMSVPEKTMTGPNTARLSITVSSHVSQFLSTAEAIPDMKGDGQTGEQTVGVMYASNDANSEFYCFQRSEYIAKNDSRQPGLEQ
jgi:hypothetical protein